MSPFLSIRYWRFHHAFWSSANGSNQYLHSLLCSTQATDTVLNYASSSGLFMSCTTSSVYKNALSSSTPSLDLRGTFLRDLENHQRQYVDPGDLLYLLDGLQRCHVFVYNIVDLPCSRYIYYLKARSSLKGF